MDHVNILIKDGSKKIKQKSCFQSRVNISIVVRAKCFEGTGSEWERSKGEKRGERRERRGQVGLYKSRVTSVPASVINSSQMARENAHTVHEFAGFDK